MADQQLTAAKKQQRFNRGKASNLGSSFNKKPLEGQMPELKNNVYQCGMSQHGNQCTKTTEAIKNYVSREHGKRMELLMDGKEDPPKKPTRPTRLFLSRRDQLRWFPHDDSCVNESPW